jgi:glyoxylase-like metal-dependent hydrolase (beta-lactamase superfamily II)
MPDLKAAIVPVTPFQQNCAILWEEPGKRGVVIDPGGEVPRILDAIGKLDVRIERILLTHGHIDHAGGAAALKEALERAGRGEGSPTIAPIPEGSAATPAPRGAVRAFPSKGPTSATAFYWRGSRPKPRASA